MICNSLVRPFVPIDLALLSSFACSQFSVSWQGYAPYPHYCSDHYFWPCLLSVWPQFLCFCPDYVVGDGVAINKDVLHRFCFFAHGASHSCFISWYVAPFVAYHVGVVNCSLSHLGLGAKWHVTCSIT